MVTTRRLNEFYVETKRVVSGRVVQTTCCCAAPGATRRGCMIVQGNKAPCRCACHPRKKKRR